MRWFDVQLVVRDWGFSVEDRERKRAQIEEEVRRTLESIDDLNDVEVGPNFYSAVWQKITAESASDDRLRHLPLGYRLAPALLVVFLLLNVVTAWVIVRASNESRAEYRKDYIEAVAGESSLSDRPFGADSDSR